MKEAAQILFDTFLDENRKANSGDPRNFELNWHEQPVYIKNIYRRAASEVIADFIKFETPQPAWAKRLEAQQNSILEAIMKTQADLDAGISTLTADDAAVLAAVATAGSATSTALQDLLAKIAANPTAPVSDFQAEVDALAQTHTDFQSAIASLQAVTDSAKADDPGAGDTLLPGQAANDAASEAAAKAPGDESAQ